MFSPILLNVIGIKFGMVWSTGPLPVPGEAVLSAV